MIKSNIEKLEGQVADLVKLVGKEQSKNEKLIRHVYAKKMECHKLKGLMMGYKEQIRKKNNSFYKMKFNFEQKIKNLKGEDNDYCG